MLRKLVSLVTCLLPLLLGVASSPQIPTLQLVPLAVEAPDSPAGAATTTSPACTSPTPVHSYAWYHCYAPSDIRSAYSVNPVDPVTGAGNLGQGQTIVLVDAYGSPTAKSDLQFFHDTFFPKLDNPNFTQVFPQGAPDFTTNGCGPNGFSAGPSGPCAAAGWSGEATLDIEWSYAIAPLAHIVLLAVPPAETEGVQGLPNLFNAIQGAIDTYPAGTIFSQSFGVTEQTFQAAGPTVTARFDQVYKAAAAKGDTVLASSGDNGTTGISNLLGTKTYAFPTVGWPASSPYLTAVGGTQLQQGWTWAPTSDTPFIPNPSNPLKSIPNPTYFAFTSVGSSEAIWNESWLPAASGGGPSVLYPRPAWQTAPNFSGNHRLVPDLSWNAAVNGGVLVYITAFPNAQRAGWHVYGGTSAGSPQMAGVVALVNNARAAALKRPIGFLSPHLYNLPGSAFSDIVPHTYGTAASGSSVYPTGAMSGNGLWAYQADGTVAPNGIAGNPVVAGYDMTTGLGRPIVSPFVAALAASP